MNANDYAGRGQSAALGFGQAEAPALDAPDGSDGLFGSISAEVPTTPRHQDADAPDCRTETAPRRRRHDGSADRHESRPRAVGYCRVSTDAQATDGVSLDAQRARIGAWADANS